MVIQKYDGEFIHGINLQDWYPVWNFTLSGRLISANFMPLVDPSFSFQKRVEDIPLDELMVNPRCFNGTMTPRSMWYVWAASIIRSGGHVGIGQIDTKWLPKKEMERIKRIGDIELEIERARREISPESASRLGCLWVADNTPKGATNVRDMLGPTIYLAKVTIPAACKVSKVDRKWFDLYCVNTNNDYLRSYWEGRPYDSNNTWEYLVDGIIESSRKEDIDYIKENGSKIL